jgi:hypothetical protein
LTQAPVRKKVPVTFLALSVARIEASAASLAPASKVRAITLLDVGRTVKSLPRRLAGGHELVVVGRAEVVVGLALVVVGAGAGAVVVGFVVVGFVVLGLVVVVAAGLVGVADVAVAVVVAPGKRVGVSVAVGDAGVGVSDDVGGATDRVVKFPGVGGS